MNKRILFFLPILMLAITAIGQERAEVAVKILKDGKVVKDTIYQYDNLEEAKEAVKVMDIIASEKIDEDDMKAMKVEIHEKHDGARKKLMMITEDGEIHEIKGEEGFKWVTSEKVEDGEKVIIKEEDGKIEVIIKEKKEGEKGEKVEIKKEVIVLSSDNEDEDVTWTVKEAEDDEDIEVIVIKKKELVDEDKMEIEVTIDDNKKEVEKKLGKKKVKK